MSKDCKRLKTLKGAESAYKATLKMMSPDSPFREQIETWLAKVAAEISDLEGA